MTAVLANAGKSEKRRELDFYPTPAEVTQALFAHWKLPLCTVWEPACGDGAMSRVMDALGYDVTSTDIRKTYFGDGGIDFLSAGARPCNAIVTNPPFNLSEAFIRRALSITPNVAMLLKSQYWHAAKRHQLFIDHPPAMILPLTWRPDFLDGERGGAPTMDVLWTVWLAGSKSSTYHPLSRPTKRPKKYALDFFAEVA